MAAHEAATAQVAALNALLEEMRRDRDRWHTAATERRGWWPFRHVLDALKATVPNARWRKVMLLPAPQPSGSGRWLVTSVPPRRLNPRVPDLRMQLKAAAPQGSVDVIVDPVGG